MRKISITYYLFIVLLKLKGIKKNFSQSPINYKALRKEDIYFPKNRLFKERNCNFFIIQKTTITEIPSELSSDKLLLYVHGGAFVSGPTKYHWNAIKRIAKFTDYNVWMCNYPKAPEHKIQEISKNIDLTFEVAASCFGSKNIVLMGDSAGATLIITLMQRLIKKGRELPFKIVLISPVMDASLENPLIDMIDQIDPMLSKKGVLSAKKMCTGNHNLKDPIISPIYENMEHFPETILFMAENDITQPDQELFSNKLMESKVKHTVHRGKRMPHIWPLLPIVRESQVSFEKIIDSIKY